MPLICFIPGPRLWLRHSSGSKDGFGVLDLYASSIPGQYYLPRLIGEFHAKCPKIRFYVDQSDSKTVIEK